MNEPKSFASLSPTLLARKGGAKPAMRSQLQPIEQFSGSLAHAIEDDLGWNDMGEGHEAVPEVAEAPVRTEAPTGAEVVPISSATVQPIEAIKPAVVHQQAAIAARVIQPASEQKARRSALDDGRRAAFTLRVDAERHLKLRLACTIRNRSAQQLVTEALDRLIDELPDLATLAAQVAKRR